MKTKIAPSIRGELVRLNGKLDAAVLLAPGVILIGKVSTLKHQVWEKKVRPKEEPVVLADLRKESHCERIVEWQAWFLASQWATKPFVTSEVTDLIPKEGVKSLTIIVPDPAYTIASVIAQVWHSLVRTESCKGRWYRSPTILGLPKQPSGGRPPQP